MIVYQWSRSLRWFFRIAFLPQCHRSPSVTGYKAENSFSVRCPTRGDARGFRDSNPVLSGFLYSFDAKQVSKIMKMNDFRTRFWTDYNYMTLARKRCRKWWKWTTSEIGFQRIMTLLWCETSAENHENERFPNPLLSGYLYSFGVKQVSKNMKMNDFRTRFWASPYVALVRNRCRKWWKRTFS